MSDDKVKKMLGKKLRTGHFKKIIKSDTDVYNEEGKLILRFRKKVLNKKTVENAYNALIKFAHKTSQIRGIAGGQKSKDKISQVEKKHKSIFTNKSVMSNIIGYFDTFSPSQKLVFKNAGMPIPKCRETFFTGQRVNQWKNVVPLIKEINNQYKLLFPKEYRKQRARARKTPFVIANTAFSTVTTNLNWQTRVHTDKGDYEKGFGNLVVIEKGKFEGGYTGFPQYGIAVDVRTCDFLGMDVHLEHANEPIKGKKGKFYRLSLVSYLRDKIAEKCMGERIITNDEMNKIKELAGTKYNK